MTLNRNLRALFRLQPNLFCFYNQIFKSECPHCPLQVIRLALLHSDIIALYPPVCMSYCGSDVGISMCAGDAAKYDVSLSKHAKLLCCTRLTQRQKRPMNIPMLQSRRSSLCSRRFDVTHKAVTGGSMLPLGHLMTRGGTHIFKSPAGRLSGSVAILHPFLSVETLHSDT